MPFKKIMRMLGLGPEKTDADMEKDAAERERKKAEEEEREKKRKKRSLQPHGRWQMSDKEFEELERASK